MDRGFGVLVPTGPGPTEVERLAAVLESVRRHEDPGCIDLLVVDDHPEPRTLPLGTGWLSVGVLRTDLWNRRKRPDPYDAMTAGTLLALKEARRRGAEFLLKLDTDALVIGPFSNRLRVAIDSTPDVGVFGSCTRTSAGTIRSFSEWERRLLKARRPYRVRRGIPVPRLRYRATRSVVDAAASSAAPLGAHCLGGAYAVTPALLHHAAGFDRRTWTGLGISEDVVLGALASACGLRLADLTDAGEVFALAHIGLPGTPEEIVGNDYAIVHSVKATETHTEAEIRAAFRRAAR
jgi:hypothetical protein